MRASCAGRFAVDSIRAIAKKLRTAIFASLDLWSSGTSPGSSVHCVNGFYYQQTTDDRRNGMPLNDDGLRGRFRDWARSAHTARATRSNQRSSTSATHWHRTSLAVVPFGSKSLCHSLGARKVVPRQRAELTTVVRSHAPPPSFNAQSFGLSSLYLHPVRKSGSMPTVSFPLFGSFPEDH